ncbi:MAG: choice-of-anchor P family protein [Marmoricola sp.]
MIRMSNYGRVLVATGLVASVLTMAGPGASPAAATPAVAATYGGFSGEGWSTPLRIELFEPSLPVPASPQVEFELAYSKVKADSGTANGRASYLWPGDTIGEGLRAFAGLLGLPVDNPITGGGYPVQVNSQYPGEPASDSDEPFPGMVMRATSGDKKSVAETGYSPDGVGPDDGKDAGAAGSGLLGGLQSTLGSLLPGLGGGKAEPSMPGLPAPLAALVDIEGLVAASQISAVDGPVTSAARSALGEVRLLGGLITIGGTEAVARATTDGAKGVATGRAQWGKLTIAGQVFSIGPDGAVVAGNKSVVPGLDKLPASALKALGISFEIPKPVRTVEGDLATSVTEGLRIIIETKLLSPLLSAIPAGKLADLIPAGAGPVKGVVAGLSSLAPKVVITLGVASATVDTVPPVGSAPLPPGGPGGPPVEAGGPVTGSLPQTAAGPAGLPPAEDAPLGDPVPRSGRTGLPALFSVPGLILAALIAAVAVAGGSMRRLGAAALGAGASCPHGLDCGLPDLRKA